MDKIKVHIKNLLASEFPAWEAKDIDSLSIGLISDYLSKNFGDDSLILSGLYEAILSAKKAKVNIDEINPGYIRSIFLQKVVKLWEPLYKRPDNVITVAIENKSESDEESESSTDLFLNSLQEQFADFDAQTSLQKIRQFAKNIIASNELSKKELKVFNCIIQVAENDALFPAINEANKKWNIKDFWNEVKSELNKEGIWLNDSDFRTTKHRIRERINTKLRDSEGFLHHITKEQKEEMEESLKLLYAALSVFSSSSSFLRAYRLSDEELDKMKWLKKEVFENNGFKFEPNRFPEVYYDDYDKINLDNNHWNPDEVNPDKLGIYRYKKSSDLPCAESYEGYIILFKDRIEAYCNRSGADIDSVRFVVLMHELGHWLSHWPKKENYNWKIGFHLPNKHTKEALAQLVAYWACKDSPIHFETLLKLTPKVVADPDKLYILKLAKDALLNDGTVINTEDPYGRYWLLKGKPIEVVLNKLHQLREGWMLKDEKMIEFLVSEYENLEQWIKSKGEIQDDDLIIKMDDRNCIRNTSPMLLDLKGFEKLSKGYKLLQGLGVDGKWYENTNK